MARRRGRPRSRAALLCSDSTKEHIQHGSVTEEQRSRRAIFDEILRAEGLLDCGFVAPRGQIHSDMAEPAGDGRDVNAALNAAGGE